MLIKYVNKIDREVFLYLKQFDFFKFYFFICVNNNNFSNFSIVTLYIKICHVYDKTILQSAIAVWPCSSFPYNTWNRVVTYVNVTFALKKPPWNTINEIMLEWFQERTNASRFV